MAFDALYRKYAFDLADKAARKIEDKNAAFDLVQDVMMNIYLQKDKLHIHTTFKGYLLISLRNRIFKYKQEQLKLKCLAQKPVQQENNNVADYINKKELEQKIKTAIANLPEQCRKVFLLSRDMQLSNKEIADRLSISVNTVEQHMRKALRILRTHIDYYSWAWWLLLWGMLYI